jgi:hypothetical protein
VGNHEHVHFIDGNDNSNVGLYQPARQLRAQIAADASYSTAITVQRQGIRRAFLTASMRRTSTRFVHHPDTA